MIMEAKMIDVNSLHCVCVCIYVLYCAMHIVYCNNLNLKIAQRQLNFVIYRCSLAPILTAAFGWLIAKIQTIKGVIAEFRQWYACPIVTWPFRQFAQRFRSINGQIIIDSVSQCCCQLLVWMWISLRICGGACPRWYQDDHTYSYMVRMGQRENKNITVHPILQHGTGYCRVVRPGERESWYKPTHRPSNIESKRISKQFWIICCCFCSKSCSINIID